MKEIKDEKNRWRNILGIGLKKYCKNDYATQNNYRFNAIQIKLPM